MSAPHSKNSPVVGHFFFMSSLYNVAPATCNLHNVKFLLSVPFFLARFPTLARCRSDSESLQVMLAPALAHVLICCQLFLAAVLPVVPRQTKVDQLVKIIFESSSVCQTKKFRQIFRSLVRTSVFKRTADLNDALTFSFYVLHLRGEGSCTHPLPNCRLHLTPVVRCGMNELPCWRQY